MSMQELLNTDNLARFIDECRVNGMRDEVILEQLSMFAKGERGVALHDSCIVLLDGTQTYPDLEDSANSVFTDLPLLLPLAPGGHA